MRGVWYRWGRVTNYTFRAFLYFGTVCGIFAELYAANQIHLNIERTFTATSVLLATALLGARLLYVVMHWQIYSQAPRRIWRASEGGASMYGGLILAVPLSVPLLAMLRIPFGEFWDVASFTMLLGIIVTRGGCLLNGCCTGKRSRGWFALNLPDHKGVWTPRIPTQILESAWSTVVLIGAIAMWSHRSFSGGLFLYTLGAYGAGRIFLESTREVQERVGGFSLNRIISMGSVGVSVTAFAVVWWR
jgi:phosphatidylglycerol:prolipoprotein diacylglycerol transferase